MSSIQLFLRKLGKDGASELFMFRIKKQQQQQKKQPILVLPEVIVALFRLHILSIKTSSARL